MAFTTNSNGRVSTEVLIPKKWNHRETSSPERNIIWIEPKPYNKVLKSVHVIYYLSRNGQLEHPHFIEVPLSSSDDGLYLKDVINRLNFLRGKGMGYLFSWSCKRSYKNGYVWHDLSENDLIHPTDGHNYILKGSELLETSMSSRFCELSLHESQKSPSDSDEYRDSSSSIRPTRTKRNQSWSSFENPRHEHRLICKCQSGREITENLMMHAATQTEEKRRKGGIIAELSREELSPALSMSSSDGKDGADRSKGVNVGDQTAENEFSSGRMSVSRVMMQLITCGSSTSADCSMAKGKSSTKNYWLS
ncbi:protein SOSEKI 5 isoform X1 [Capsicum annuum]|uniref:protein SOSEKI 5 isoform X1 n=1 Tax=Capsicum annuum TaxID=4072 RepID=UPI001FB057CF|nr:protein SOSEKI 5 isoform X1 [Capsicum annuum]